MATGLVRAFNVDTDAAAIARLDTSFTASRVFRVERTNDIISLDSVPIEPPVEKHFPLNLGTDPWQSGWVITVGGAVVGFIATAVQNWNRRLIIWHFYVDRSCRRRGYGRQLVERAVADGAAAGMMTAWVETSNLNYPGVQAYGRLGFSICGFDLTLYRGTSSHKEFALFLAQPIGPVIATSNAWPRRAAG
jgi:ribosomal protein S18 acetylase RimI-like enzyme